jgi:uncharacterized protein YjbJ (UPF0337 family)
LDQVQRQAEQLIGRIQERYGVAKDDARRQFDAWLKDEKMPTSAPSTRS